MFQQKIANFAKNTKQRYNIKLHHRSEHKKLILHFTRKNICSISDSICKCKQPLSTKKLPLAVLTTVLAKLAVTKTMNWLVVNKIASRQNPLPPFSQERVTWLSWCYFFTSPEKFSKLSFMHVPDYTMSIELIISFQQRNWIWNLSIHISTNHRQ